MTVNEESIEVEEIEDIYDQISFIKNKLCSNAECIEIGRQVFDDFYKKTSDLINKVSSF